LDYTGFKSLDFVIEAIVEDLEIKKKVLADLENHVRDGAILATNTSSLSVTEMQKALRHSSRFVGMHFFNPVDKMPLVEVIRGEKTSDIAVATTFELAKKMGKMPVVVKDGPGFLVNRLLLPYMAEAMFLLQEGADIDTVDRLFVNEFGMPMGPFTLMDEVGLDVCFKVLKIFRKAFGERIEIAPLVEKLEQTNRLGKKNLKGFYTYDDKGKRLEVDREVYGEMGLGSPRHPHSNEECIERGIFAMINECARAVVDDGIVQSAAEVDLAMIMGTGFPPFRGGLLKYADKVGITQIIQKLESYSVRAPRLKPSEALKSLAQTSFYSRFK
jgi:3-hydroxyacyl-CoA dehydrogenase/enoyl-CoA hydratase/3-hydroxybutyryl-CoA epimerase